MEEDAGSTTRGISDVIGEVEWSRVTYHSLNELLTDDTILANAFQFETLSEWIRVRLLEVTDRDRWGEWRVSNFPYHE